MGKTPWFQTAAEGEARLIVVYGGRGEPYGAWAILWRPGQSEFYVHLAVNTMIDPIPSKVFTHYGDNDDQPPTPAQAVNIMIEWLAIGGLAQDG